MQLLHRTTAAAVILLALAVVPAAAQNYRFDIGVNGGFAWWSDGLDEDALFIDRTIIDGDIIDEIVDFDTDAKFDAGGIVGAQATFWALPYLGIRANANYTERPFETDGFTLVNDVNLWSGSGDLLFRFRRPNREWRGTEVLPYVALGAGAKWVNPAGDDFDRRGLLIDIIDDIIDDGVIIDDNIIVEDGLNGGIFFLGNRAFVLEDETKFMGLVGLGTDVRLAPNFALRLEVGDRIWEVPIRELFVDVDVIDEVNGDEIIVIRTDEDDVGKVNHEIYGTIGAHLLLGLERPRRPVVIAPPPPPAPAPPAEEMITVCVVDPTAPGGLREVSAVYVPTTGDTLVTVNGQRVPLRTTVGTVMTARNASWFMAGQPLTIMVRGQQEQFVTFGGGRVIEPEELTYLGMVNGLAVYASREDAAQIEDELAQQRQMGRTELGMILEQDATVRQVFETIDVLYVPLEATGCVFQPLQRIEEVRKVRG
ncbi:MAG TPA: outer membrane beta-barrel protein [Longimicrobiales bacterium]